MSEGKRIVLWDLDGVIIDFVTAYLDTAYALYGLRFVRDDVTDWSFQKCLGLTVEQDASIWESDELHASMRGAAVLPGGRRAFDAHLAAGDEMHLATARGTGANGQGAAQMKAERGFTEDYLSERGFMPAGVTLDFRGDKVVKAQEIGATMVYDDAPHNAMDLATAGFRVVMPVFAYNAHVPEHVLITRATGWELP